jgi:hypothetical protein
MVADLRLGMGVRRYYKMINGLYLTTNTSLASGQHWVEKTSFT